MDNKEHGGGEGTLPIIHTVFISISELSQKLVPRIPLAIIGKHSPPKHCD
jgi:hypothetical protein